MGKLVHISPNSASTRRGAYPDQLRIRSESWECSRAGPLLYINDVPIGTKAVFTLGPVPYRILANRSRRVDLVSGLHSHY